MDRIAGRLASITFALAFACASAPLEEALSEDTELVRAVVTKLTNGAPAPRVPTRVFVFSRKSAFRPPDARA